MAMTQSHYVTTIARFNQHEFVVRLHFILNKQHEAEKKQNSQYKVILIKEVHTKGSSKDFSISVLS